MSTDSAAPTRKRRRWDNADAAAPPSGSAPAPVSAAANGSATSVSVAASAAGAAATAQELKRRIDERLKSLNVPVSSAPNPSPLVAQQVAVAQQQIAARLQGVTNPMIAAALQATQGLGRQERKIHGIRLDDQGRLVDAEGNVIEMTRSKVPELLANRQKDKAAVKEEAEPAPAAEPVNKYFDPSLDIKPVERKGRHFHFVKEGKFVHQAQSLRMKQLSREMRQRVRSALAETSEALVAPSRAKALIPDSHPQVEWWDQELLGGDSYTAPLNETAVTALVLHPVPLPPVAEPPPPPPLPLMLTQKEKDKLRRQRKQQEHKEKTDMIRFGLVPAPEPKMTLKNMYRVLEHDATINPSALEKKVRQQMAERVAKHEKANADRKLTPEQRREKKRKKLAENTETEVHVAVFKAGDLKAPQVRFKVDVTAQQYNLTGCAILFPECNTIVVEGGPKGIKKFTRMVLERIKWDMVGTADDKEQDDDAKSDEEEEEKPQKSNKCFLVWQGVSDSRKFRNFRFENCISEAMSRKYLADKGLGHFWDFAKQYKPDV